VSDNDSKDIVRRWNREIEAEIRREAARRDHKEPWKAVTLSALWLVWLAFLVLMLMYVKTLH
jgi:hypothetical protein